MSRVAIAMAVYDDERYLRLALEALAAQTFRDFRLIVYDDGSKDRSAEVAENFAARFPIEVVRGPHRGRQLAKEEARRRAGDAPYLLVLDSDVELPPDALERMVALLDSDSCVAVVSAQARSDEGRPFGPSQAFLEDVFYRSNVDESGSGRWIVGGCAMFRAAALRNLEVRSDVGEDNDLSEKLRAHWKLVVPSDLTANHYGVPVTLGGVLRRFYRDGVRVRALLRVYPRARQLGNIARLAPLPIAVGAMGAAVLGFPRGAIAGGVLFVGYIAAFLWASRHVAARAAVRITGAVLFAFGNLGFAVGYGREALRGTSGVMHEPPRPAR